MELDWKRTSLILLTKSRKYGNYCVAAIDVENRKLVRLVSNEVSIYHSIRPEHLITAEGAVANILDEIIIETSVASTQFQPENVQIATKNIVITNEVDIDMKIKLLDELSNTSDKVFYTDYRWIEHSKLASLPSNTIHSLEIIKVDLLIVRLKDETKKSLKANFLFRNKWHNEFPITDTDFTNKYFDETKSNSENKLVFKNVYLVISLSLEYLGNHYKLIASVISV